MFVLYLFILILGLWALITGASLLVKKAVALARRFSVNPFFVGVILLGMGTSAPEWAVSALSSLKGLSDLAVSNIFGSNIFNLLLVLGLILLNPLSKERIQLIKKDILFLVLSGFILIPVMFDYFISRVDAFFLTLIFVAYIVFSLFSARRERLTLKLKAETEKAKEPVGVDEMGSESDPPSSFLKEVLLISLGFVLLIGGSYLTVIGASGLGQILGVSDRLIGILIVSVGTSLPELLTSLMAILKGQKDMAVGNIIGSNVFNTFAIFSTSAWILPASLNSKTTEMDLPALLLIHIALLLIIFCYQFKWIQKWLPYVFFSGYIVYIVFLLTA